ncbi:hypothetical protein ACFY2W_17975 [Streptomyces sp. NPDC001262]|uniref:hypothetical protein n=1 Tax=unclassified Streptomyces TaxID=2593676 RepID=UPI00368EA832
MSKRFALLYSDDVSRTLDNLLKNNADAFQRIVAALRTFAGNPYAPGAPRVNEDGLAELRQPGLFRAACHVAGTPERGGVVTTVRLLALA